MAKGTTVRMWRRTLFVLIALIAIGFGAVVFSLVKLQLIQGPELQQRAVDQQLRDATISAQRGTIYDCNMTPLAQSATVWTVVLEPAYIKDDKTRETIVNGLSEILGMDKEDVMKHAQKKNAYEILKRKVETEVKDEILAFKDENDIASGVRLVEDYKRYYPFGKFASSILGFTGDESQGLAGLEAEYDEDLTGVAGRLVTAKNAIGTDMPFQYEQKVDAKNGYSLVLSIDQVVQHFLEKNLEEGVINNKVQNRSAGIVINVKTGEILAMAVKGDYDPNDPFTITDQAVAASIQNLPEDQRKEARKNALEAQWRNKAVSDTYYPGSVFKMCTGSMGLEEGVITENSSYTCNGSVNVSGTTIHCWKSGHGTETFVQGLCNSCNPFFIHIGELLGPANFFEYFKGFGFTERTGIDLPGEAGSLYYTAEQLNPVELATESFGQNFSITPIQMITACAAVANGGYLVQPHVVKQVIDDKGNIVRTADTSVKRQVISEETSRRMCAILQQNATVGTAKNGYLPGYRVAGKTGTSEKIAQKNETGVEEYIASYCGFAPADDPQIAMLIFFDEPHGDSYYGGAVAGPVWAKTMEEILPYLGVERKYTESELDKLDVTTPQVTDKSVAAAKSELDSVGLSAKVYGEGETVISQIPEYGKTIPKNGTVVLFTDEQSSSKTVKVPNLVGLTLSQANSVAADSGINLIITGAALTSGSSAKSHSQSIEAGTEVAPGTVVTVQFVEFDQVQ